jgi:hypothetical protein
MATVGAAKYGIEVVYNDGRKPETTWYRTEAVREIRRSTALRRADVDRVVRKER